MNCPICNYKKNILMQISVAISGHFVCSNCKAMFEVKSRKANIFDWAIELFFIPLGLVLMIFVDNHYLFIFSYLVFLFFVWLLMARGSTNKILAREKATLKGSE